MYTCTVHVHVRTFDECCTCTCSKQRAFFYNFILVDIVVCTKYEEAALFLFWIASCLGCCNGSCRLRWGVSYFDVFLDYRCVAKLSGKKNSIIQHKRYKRSTCLQVLRYRET